MRDVKCEANAGPPGESGCGCECRSNRPGTPPSPGTGDAHGDGRILNVELLAIDLDSCRRCVPTSAQMKRALHLLQPVADALGVELRHREIVVRTSEQARETAFATSPTIRLNGRDIAQDIYESECESCGDLARNGTGVDCREWHYRGQVHPSVPLPLLVEAITDAMLRIDELPPVTPGRLEELPENLERFFANKT